MCGARRRVVISSRMRFAGYFYTSLAATVGLIAHVVFTREQFYPIVLYLVTSKISFVVLGNMAIACVLLMGQALMKSLRGHISGLCQPTYILDIPGGFGKVTVGPTYAAPSEKEGWCLEDYKGTLHPYPLD